MRKISMLLLASSLISASVMAQHEVECDFTSISSNVTTNTTLSASTLYRIEGCIHVVSGVTLTIPAGTVIMGEKSSNATLIIDRGAQLVSQGTSSNPVTFTSDQEPTYRVAGDWGGIDVLGYATNNQSNSISIERTCSITGGGTNDNDNSGVLKYMRIEYPEFGLTMLSVGDQTDFHDVQVSYASKDAFQLFGGTVKAKRLVSLNAKGSDIISKFGNRSLVQYVINIRLDAAAHLSAGPLSNSIVMGNNDNSGSSYSGTPANHPVFSNISIIGPLYCGGSGLSSDFKNAVLYYHNTQGGVYNSMIAGWPTGLRMEDATTLNNADVNYNLNFFENSFYSNTTNYSHNGSWPASCATDMTEWIDGSSPGSCVQPNNQFPSYTLGYSSTVCGTYSSTMPSFLLGTTGLLNADFPSGTDLDNAFFTSTSQKHGALNSSTDWTTSWTEWYPQGVDYCPGQRAVATGINNTGIQPSTLQLVPNPSNGITYAEFATVQAGKVNISIVNSVGQVVRIISKGVEKGKQSIAVNTEGLSTGVYIVNIELPKGSTIHARIMVK